MAKVCWKSTQKGCLSEKHEKALLPSLLWKILWIAAGNKLSYAKNLTPAHVKTLDFYR